MKGVVKKINQSSEIVLSRNKAIIFAIIIDVLTSLIISFGSYDIIIAFYGQKMPVDRFLYASVLFPGVFVIIGAILVSYILVSLKWNPKRANKAKK